MKRKMLSVLLAGLMICSFGGCGGSGEDEGSKKGNGSKEDVEVVTWNTARADDHAIIKAVTACLDAYNETAETPIEIKFEYIPDRPTQEEKLKTEIAAGDMPTFFDCDPNPYLNQVAKTGQLVNIGELIDEMGIRDNFIPFTLEYQTVDSGLYGFPLECNTEFFFYNKEMFQDAQCEEPETFDEFLEVCEKLKEAGYTPYAICGADGWPLQRLFSFLPFREAGNDFIDQTIRGDESLTSDIGMEALDFVRTMGGYFQEGWATMDNSTTQQLFTGGGAGDGRDMRKRIPGDAKGGGSRGKAGDRGYEAVSGKIWKGEIADGKGGRIPGCGGVFGMADLSEDEGIRCMYNLNVVQGKYIEKPLDDSGVFLL